MPVAGRRHALHVLSIRLVVLVGLLSVPARPLSAQAPTVAELDVDVEGGPLTGWMLTVAPHAQVVLDGEIFESLSLGQGGSVAFAAYFDERYAVRLRVAVTRNKEANQYWDDMTTTLDGWLEVRWIRRVLGMEMEVGPTVGYARVSRPIYVYPAPGFLAGLGVGAAKPVVGSLEIVLGVHATWSSFARPYIAGPTPPGFDSDVGGRRVVLSLGMGHRW